MISPKKAVHWKLGDTFIPPSDTRAGRAAVILFSCGWLFWGGWVFLKLGVIQAAFEHGHLKTMIFLIFLLWLIGLVLICAWIAWLFFGATMISVTAEELVVRYCIAGAPIFTSNSIDLSKIIDISIEEIDVRFRRRTWHLWELVVRSDDGDKHLVARFNNGLDANESLAILTGSA